MKGRETTEAQCVVSIFVLNADVEQSHEKLKACERITDCVLGVLFIYCVSGVFNSWKWL